MMPEKIIDNEIAITFNEKKCNKVKFKCKSGTSTVHVLEILDKIKFPLPLVEEETLKFLILELLTNSLRASDEIKSAVPVETYIEINGNDLIITVQDGAGGFDTSVLPYEISQEPSHIDILSEDFIKYREQYGFERFGMGLYSVKVWSDKFDLCFVDDAGNCVDYKGAGSVNGTRISFQKNILSILNK